ncbi:hypothetical protein Poly51_19560 [Rubripirellula tenax]|uniref:Transposase IS204/IS1001/IS1096/IS1165 zinc-finger domain-containing protein n=1 Tax=Rubripirellula tenax TaxID=2528015 RepID=A0A5C6FEZ1_9BACT|nr:hypothetical protein Poly51_19560 [Rubripirellula tenax]
MYQSFAIRGYQQTRIGFVQGVTRFHDQFTEGTICCPACQSNGVLRRGAKQREFKASPIHLKASVVVAALPRMECRDCGTIRQIEVGFADAGRTSTKAWAKHALQLTRIMTIKSEMHKTATK